MKYSRASARSAIDSMVYHPSQADDLQPALAVHLRAKLRGGVAVSASLGLHQQATVALCDAPEQDDLVAWRRRGGAVAKALVAAGAQAPQIDVSSYTADQAAALLLGMGQAVYAFDHYRPKASAQLKQIFVQGLAAKALPTIQQQLNALVLCRDLINTPAMDLGPAEFVQQARKACKGTGLQLRVLSEAVLKQKKAGSLLAVGQASPRRPRMLVIERKGRGKPLALCGKGVCFDTGGLQIKPGTAMSLMRKDMGGAATVLASMLLLANETGRTVRAYIPLVENNIDGAAFRPGDILTAMDGTTIEVGHTDAEGRLILADAICLAKKEQASSIVTVATLTGAAMVALGRIHVPIMGDDAACAALQTAAQASGEKVWQLPLDDDHRAMVKSKVAVLTNSAGPEASCITASAFLQHFAGDVPFAHADISPASWAVSPNDLGPVGATGAFVTTLAEFCRSYKK